MQKFWTLKFILMENVLCVGRRIHMDIWVARGANSSRDSICLLISSPFLIQPLLLLLEITVSLTFIKIPLLFFILSATMKCIILSSFIQCHIFKINPYCLY